MGSEIPSAILTALLSGQTVLTANQPAARALRRAFDESQQAAGAALWIPPNIFALDTWLPNLFHQLLLDGVESRLLLNRVQEHSLWRALIAADPSVSGLRSVDTLAEMAAEAWQILHLYNGRARLREFAVSTDTRAFQRWAEAFERTCTGAAYLTPAQLPAALAAALAEGNLPLPNAGLILVDFDRLAPAHSDLFESIRQAGFAVERIATTVAVKSAILFTPREDPSEIRAAALSAKRQLEENPTASIAIVVPNLADRRGQLDRVFHETLGNRYEFSLGRSLAETSLIQTALDLLRWPLESLPLESVSALLLSPFFAANPEESLARVEFDAFELRSATFLRPEISLDAMIVLVHGSKRSQKLTALIKTLYAMRRAASDEQIAPRANDPTRPHAAWADAFRALLEAAGWTSASNADSLTFQTRRRFESALDELATLDFDGSRVSAAAVLKTLNRIARQTVFAPESRNAPVQIVGPLEPGGVPFDALWFLGANDTSWPTPAVPHPLIPWHLQRDLGIPGCDPIRDSLIAQTLTDRLAHSAPSVVFTFALRSEEGDRRPSPLLRALELTHLPESLPEPSLQPLSLIDFADTEPLPPLPAGLTHGGARILELQAACAFRAFAELRLSSTQPDTRNPGLDDRERGNHVHEIMRAFYTRVPSRDALRALPPAERASILDESIELALAKAAAHVRAPWDAAYLDVQRRRLRSLLNPWLNSELTRPPFTVRQREEELNAAQIGPLYLKLRADRIDDTPGGSLIIDYKTGAATTAEWLSDRPDKPQLPLYAILAEPAGKLGGVAFALLRAGKDLALTGFADGTQVLPKPTKSELSLAEQLQDWRRVLTDLAVAFAQADPIADPKSYPATCKYCTQRILCRLDTSALETPDEEDDEAFAEAVDA